MILQNSLGRNYLGNLSLFSVFPKYLKVNKNPCLFRICLQTMRYEMKEKIAERLYFLLKCDQFMLSFQMLKRLSYQYFLLFAIFCFN